MAINVYQRMVFICGAVALFGLHSFALSQAQRPSVAKSHRHLRMGRSVVGVDIPEFSMTETSSEAGVIKDNLVTNRSREFDAFTDSDRRIFVAERRTGKIYEIRGLPLEWRPFSNLIWANNRILMFDRWSQPHYGVHYAVNVSRRKLMVAIPFPDKFYLQQQRPKPRSSQSPIHE